MEYGDIVSFITSVGFPIVACVFMFRLNKEQATAHKEEMASMTEALNNLKLAINSLIDKLEG